MDMKSHYSENRCKLKSKKFIPQFFGLIILINALLPLKHHIEGKQTFFSHNHSLSVALCLQSDAADA